MKGTGTMKDGFMTPPKHINFEAKKLFGAMGQIIDGSIAYITLKGGGPTEQHTHEHNHLFIVVKGEAKVLMNDEEIIIPENEAFLVKGTIPHSVWSNQDNETIMIGISVK
jgi:mannose-6-phosphate isomerase-like protein (cupin superfamily)